MIKFKYKNKEYIIFFYPCGNYLRVTEKKTNKTSKTREFKYNKNTTIKTFLNVLDKIQF